MILALSTGGTILYSIIVFLLVILLLVSVLLFARDKLAPKGKVNLQINDREMEVSPGPICCQLCRVMGSSYHPPVVAVVPVVCANAR